MKSSSAPRRHTVKSLLVGAWEATIDERTKFWIFVVFYVLASTADLLSPWAIGYTLGVFVKEGMTEKAMEHGIYGIFIYTGLRFLYAFFHHFARYLQNTVTYSARMHTLRVLFSDLMRFPLRWHIDSHSGENLSKLNRSAGAVDSMVGTYIWQIVEGLVKVVGASLALIALDYRVALNVVFLAALTIAVMVLFNGKLMQRIRENNAFVNKLNRICVDYLFNIVTVKTLSLEAPAVKYLQDQRAQGLVYAKQIAKYMEFKWSTTSVGYALVIGSSLYIYFLSHKGMRGAFDVAGVYVLLNYLDRIFQAIGSFTGYYGGVLEAATAYEDAQWIHERAAQAPVRESIPQMNPLWHEVRMEQVKFSYVEGESSGLEVEGLTIHRGEKIALIGPSGGGKSTLLKIMAGLLHPPAGAKLSTDVENSISLEQLTEQCLLIPQEPEIFSESVRYNMTMGQSFSDQQVDFIIKLCRLEQVLQKLPRGLDTSLSEKGLNMSGGEKQRVGLARGLLRAAQRPVLLLDEPTSSLDPVTEKAIFNGVLEGFSDRTVMSACHRLSLVPLFDRIIFINQGRVEEVGTFQELIDQRGFFYKTWTDYEQKVMTDGVH